MNATITKDPETIDRLSYGYLEIVHFGFEDDGGKYHDGIYEFMPEEQPELPFHKGNRVELFGDFSHFKDTRGNFNLTHFRYVQQGEIELVTSHPHTGEALERTR